MTDEYYADPEVCQAILMDYYRNPRCAGVCDPATHVAEATNPACGDVVTLSFQVEADRILQARTIGTGCAVSQASASLLAEQLQGKSLKEARVVLEAFGQMLERASPLPHGLDRLLALQMITGNPARVRCATTARQAAWQALGVP